VHFVDARLPEAKRVIVARPSASAVAVRSDAAAFVATKLKERLDAITFDPEDEEDGDAPGAGATGAARGAPRRAGPRHPA
jgi:hypothetical protein